MKKEKERLESVKHKSKLWHKWGPYLTARQWGTVREDYSANGDAWDFISHDAARSKAYRWGEEGIGGISDNQQLICFAVALWNKKDPILKERYFGLTGNEGNHGEDVKEYFYYLDNTPTHSYMKMLYKYPQAEYPYKQLLEENKRRTKVEAEFELIDTGIFNEDKYFDVFIEYAKNSEEDILIKITSYNRGKEKAALNILPQIWFRNTWSWSKDNSKPKMFSDVDSIKLVHEKLGEYNLYYDENPEALFCENETNNKRLYNVDNTNTYLKDGINDYITQKIKSSVNPSKTGTKASLNYDIEIDGGSFKSVRLRLVKNSIQDPFQNFDLIFKQKINEADEFYADIQAEIKSDDAKNIQRQAFAGMLWSKQFYYYDVEEWINGDKGQPKPPAQRKEGRNKDWLHLNNADIISMPDKWEYPWYATWDLAFHCISFAIIDPEFAKKQLVLFTREWYMHPNGQLPAYEWNFSDVNPPVHAWAAWRVYKIDQKLQGKSDTDFLERVFHKLLLNFTWWVNKKDYDGRNIFQGGFLGLDNIGVFNRSTEFTSGERIDQSDGTSWMAMFSLNMLRISLELSKTKSIYQDLATKFFEHFLYIAQSMTNMGGEGIGLWDEEDGFYYDNLHINDSVFPLKVRSMVGLIPLFAVEVLEPELMNLTPEFNTRLNWFLTNKPEMASLVSRWNEKGSGERTLLSLLRGHRMKKLLKRMLDETEFLSDYGVRALSKYYDQNPYEINVLGINHEVKYTPAESNISLYGGNSNWRGPIWFPVNFLIIESLYRFHHYYGDDFQIECPTNSGKFVSIKDAADELTNRLSKIFLRDENGLRPVFGNNNKFQNDSHFKDYLLFNEYFHGDNGSGLGASHQTGWTGLIAKILQPKRK
ncbi:MAG: glucosidase [Ignavibacteriaceae bacterium]|nr:glucosidase [Ignavibacterium sp.]MCC6255347.1 glucosidase [Ignavibacteriaceae bacterium]